MNANDTYHARRAVIGQQIVLLQAELAKMDVDQASAPKDWGFAGNAGHVLETLNEALSFISDKEVR